MHEPYSGPLKTENRFKGTQIVTGKLRHEKSQFGNNDGTFAPALMMWYESKDQYQDWCAFAPLPCTKLWLLQCVDAYSDCSSFTR